MQSWTKSRGSNWMDTCGMVGDVVGGICVHKVEIRTLNETNCRKEACVIRDKTQGIEGFEGLGSIGSSPFEGKPTSSFRE